MRNEISSAVDFLSNLINNKGSGWLQDFKENLSDILCERYHNHWFPESPNKGCAYRCIRIAGNEMDPVIAKAGSQCGVTASRLQSVLPPELTLWIDPEEVSYRIGEEGSIGTLYKGSSNDCDSQSESEDSETMSRCSSTGQSLSEGSLQTSDSSAMFNRDSARSGVVHGSETEEYSPRSSPGMEVHPMTSHAYQYYNPSQELYNHSCRDQYRYLQPVMTTSGYWPQYVTRYVSS